MKITRTYVSYYLKLYNAKDQQALKEMLELFINDFTRLARQLVGGVDEFVVVIKAANENWIDIAKSINTIGKYEEPIPEDGFMQWVQLEFPDTYYYIVNHTPNEKSDTNAS